MKERQRITEFQLRQVIRTALIKKLSEASIPDKYKKSFITPSNLNQIFADAGYDTTSLRGGDFIELKRGIIQMVKAHGFKDESHRRAYMQAVGQSSNPAILYKKLFDLANAFERPGERLTKRAR